MDNTQEQRLQAEILAESQEKAEKVLARARNDIKRMETKAASDREQLRKNRLAETEAEAAAALKALNSQITIEERRRLLLAREAEIGKIFQQALALAASRPENERRQSLTGLAAEAIRALGPGEYRVTCNEADLAIVTAEFLDKIAAETFAGQRAACQWLIAADNHMRGGIRFAATDNSRNFDNSLEGRLAFMDRELRMVLLQANLTPGNE